MHHDSLSILLGRMIAAGSITCLPARTSWPMHQVLRELYDEAGRRGLLHLLPAKPTFTPCPEAALRALGADRGIRDLAHEGLVTEQGRGLQAVLTVDQKALTSWRRSLMRSDPRLMPLIQRCGERWAALASTSANSLESARSSSGPIVLSATA